MNAQIKKHDSGEDRSPKKSFRRPAYEVFSHDDSYELDVYMPGVAKDGVKVSLNGRRLEIEGSRHYRPHDQWRALAKEIAWDDFRLTLDLNITVKEEAIVAKVEDGVLSVTLPKPEEVKPRMIEVQ